MKMRRLVTLSMMVVVMASAAQAQQIAPSPARMVEAPAPAADQPNIRFDISIADEGGGFPASKKNVVLIVQGGGAGSELIRSALAIAKTLGEELVFVLGEPDYYGRFGFSAEAAAPFESPYAGPYFMALWLQPDLDSPAKGSAAYAPAFARLG